MNINTAGYAVGIAADHGTVRCRLRNAVIKDEAKRCTVLCPVLFKISWGDCLILPHAGEVVESIFSASYLLRSDAGGRRSHGSGATCHPDRRLSWVDVVELETGVVPILHPMRNPSWSRGREPHTQATKGAPACGI